MTSADEDSDIGSALQYANREAALASNASLTMRCWTAPRSRGVSALRSMTSRCPHPVRMRSRRTSIALQPTSSELRIWS